MGVTTPIAMEVMVGTGRHRDTHRPTTLPTTHTARTTTADTTRPIRRRMGHTGRIILHTHRIITAKRIFLVFLCEY